MDLQITVEAHAALSDSKDLPKLVKANKRYGTSMELFSKVDLQSVLKAIRWMSGGSGQSRTLGSWWEDCHSHFILLCECYLSPVLSSWLGSGADPPNWALFTFEGGGRWRLENLIDLSNGCLLEPLHCAVGSDCCDCLPGLSNSVSSKMS